VFSAERIKGRASGCAIDLAEKQALSMRTRASIAAALHRLRRLAEPLNNRCDDG